MHDGATPNKREQVSLEEHVASRKDWGRYVELATEVHRSVVSEAHEFLAAMRGRLDQALQRTSNGRRE
jgi:hypothetical protein